MNGERNIIAHLINSLERVALHERRAGDNTPKTVRKVFNMARTALIGEKLDGYLVLALACTGFEPGYLGRLIEDELAKHRAGIAEREQQKQKEGK